MGEHTAAGLGAFNMPLTFRCALWDAALFDRALTTVGETFPTLGFRFFVDVDGILWQQPSARPPTIETRRRAVKDEPIEHSLASASWEPLDLVAGVNARVHVFELSDSEVVVLLVVHHIALDDWSCGLLQQHLWTTYDDLRHGRDPFARPTEGVTFLRYAASEAQWLNSPEARVEQAKLTQRCSALSRPWAGHLIAASGPLAGGWGELHERELEADIARAAVQRGRGMRCTAFVVGLTAFIMALQSVTTSCSVGIGIASACRESEETLATAGLLSSLTPIVVDCSTCRNSEDYLVMVNQSYLTSFDYERLPMAWWRSAVASGDASSAALPVTYGYSDEQRWPLPEGVTEYPWRGFAPVRVPLAAEWNASTGVQALSLCADPKLDQQVIETLVSRWAQAFTELAEG